jgi:hypothetical protein
MAANDLKQSRGLVVACAFKDRRLIAPNQRPTCSASQTRLGVAGMSMWRTPTFR